MTWMVFPSMLLAYVLVVVVVMIETIFMCRQFYVDNFNMRTIDEHACIGKRRGEAPQDFGLLHMDTMEE